LVEQEVLVEFALLEVLQVLKLLARREFLELLESQPRLLREISLQPLFSVPLS
jgi:hypothetical protein